MSSISFYNSESINMLLSSGSMTRKSNSIFGSQGYAFSGIDLSTLSSIRNGSYHKLLKSYYEKEDNDGTTADRTNKKDTTTDTASQKLNGAAVRDKAADVVDSVSDLKKTALWEKKSVTDKEGNTTKEYDTDAIYKAVSDFVSNYNSLVEKTGKSDDNSVLRNASSMVSYTKANQSVLKSIGITIGSDNKLSVDAEKFKQSDMAVVKSTFTGSSSFGQTVSRSASSLYSSAVSQIAKLDSATTYSSTGSYSYVTSATYNKYL
ncbi:MAG: hypothetical protein J6O72_09415 [Lachnospira sp.]|nr:hypothetical protein [Lachnospira sp.]